MKTIFKLNCLKFECKNFISIPDVRRKCKTAVINSELFVFGGCSEIYQRNDAVKNFCSKIKTWSRSTLLNLDENDFYVSSFEKDLYVISETGIRFANKLKKDKWIKRAEMNQIILNAICTVF